MSIDGPLENSYKFELNPSIVSLALLNRQVNKSPYDLMNRQQIIKHILLIKYHCIIEVGESEQKGVHNFEAIFIIIFLKQQQT